MGKVASDKQIIKRKDDHLRINLEEDVQFKLVKTGLDDYMFSHRAIPELNLDEIDIAISFLGKTLSIPLLISSMTGGTEEAYQINQRLAECAEKYSIAIGVGSQRSAIEHPATARTFRIRDKAPTTLVFANLGAIQMNYGYGIDECLRAVEMIEADALILHFNVLQEAVQAGGETRWLGLINKIAEVSRTLNKPIIAKEVGWGFSADDISMLIDAGVSAIDTAGAGGTSWSQVEYHRAPDRKHAEVAKAFAGWGRPTVDVILDVKRISPDIPLIASGGLRNGIDIAKCIALGADICGIAGPFLKAANESIDAICEQIEIIQSQLMVAMLCAGAASLADLRSTPLLRTRG